MAKNSPLVALAIRNPHTESLQNATLIQPARGVIFPDGKNLVEKWNSEVVIPLELSYDVLTCQDSQLNTYRWGLTVVGGNGIKLSTHTKPSISATPAIRTEVKDRYDFEIPIPPTLADGSTAIDISNCAINVTEESKSTFVEHGTIHDFYIERGSAGLIIHVWHYKSLYTARNNAVGSDTFMFTTPVNLDSLSYVTGDFSIQIEGPML